MMFSLGEPADFLSFKLLAPEIIMEVQGELRPIFEEYQKVMASINGKFL